MRRKIDIDMEHIVNRKGRNMHICFVWYISKFIIQYAFLEFDEQYNFNGPTTAGKRHRIAAQHSISDCIYMANACNARFAHCFSSPTPPLRAFNQLQYFFRIKLMLKLLRSKFALLKFVERICLLDCSVELIIFGKNCEFFTYRWIDANFIPKWLDIISIWLGVDSTCKIDEICLFLHFYMTIY